jgi:steroid delta-isomerase-like uncharacterized protein
MKTLSSTFFRFGLLFVALVFTACQPIQANAPQRQSVAEQNMAIVQRFYDELSAGNPDVILEIHPETIRMHYAGTAEDVPTQVLRDDLAALKQANPDLRAEIHALFAAGDIVVTELTWTTTHTGDYFGVPPTGKTTLHNGIVVRRLANGKIVESWEMFDDLSFMQSIGYLPDWEALVAQGPMAE